MPASLSFTVSGIVFAVQAGTTVPTPLGDAALDISVEYQSWPPVTKSDANGRFSWSGSGPSNAAQSVRADVSGFSQPCPVSFSPSQTAVVNVYLVDDRILATSGIPSTVPTGGPTITGKTFERMADGSRQAVSGVKIIADFTGALGWAPSATTVSDANGDYLICGATSVLGIELYASKAGYHGAEVSAGNRGGQFDIEMTK